MHLGHDCTAQVRLSADWAAVNTLAGTTEQGSDDGEEPDQAAGIAGGALAVDADDDAAVCGALFRGLVFYLGREVPREPLLLVLRAFGGSVGWEGDGSPLQEADESITHQVHISFA